MISKIMENLGLLIYTCGCGCDQKFAYKTIKGTADDYFTWRDESPLIRSCISAKEFNVSDPLCIEALRNIIKEQDSKTSTKIQNAQN